MHTYRGIIIKVKTYKTQIYLRKINTINNTQKYTLNCTNLYTTVQFIIYKYTSYFNITLQVNIAYRQVYNLFRFYNVI